MAIIGPSYKDATDIVEMITRLTKTCTHAFELIREDRTKLVELENRLKALEEKCPGTHGS